MFQLIMFSFWYLWEGLFGRLLHLSAVFSKCHSVSGSKSLRGSNLHLSFRGSLNISDVPQQLKCCRLLHFAYIHVWLSLASCINQCSLNLPVISVTGDHQTNASLGMEMLHSAQTEVVQLQSHKHLKTARSKSLHWPSVCDVSLLSSQ